MGVHAVAEFEVERVEQFALQVLADRAEVSGESWQFIEQIRVLLGRSTGGQGLELFELRLPDPGQVCVPALKPFAEIPVDLLIAAGDLLFDLGQDVVLALTQVENLLLEPVTRGVALRGRLRQLVAQGLDVRSAEDAHREELVHEVEQIVLADPQTLGVTGIPVAAILVVAHVGLACVVLGVPSALAVHPPVADVAEEVGTELVRPAGLWVAAGSWSCPRALPAPPDRGGRLKQLLGHQRLMRGAR
ncbi:hypothetical protein ACGFJC_53355 [Nonomuraea fuscirosea]|uniref:hypothetical protein n=1 Tax=Nonomuraea fuscirosea TaxID=1291556 RepID=UPI003490EA7E